MTFKNIANQAHQLQDPQAPSHPRVNQTLHLVERLAKAMDRLEYNVAVQLAEQGSFTAAHKTHNMNPLQAELVDTYIGLLRADVPDDDV